MFCCSRNILDAVERRRSYNVYKQKEQKDDGNELVTICDNKVTIVNIVKKGNDKSSKLKNGKNNIIKKPAVGKSNVLKYYETNFLKDKDSRDAKVPDAKKGRDNKDYDSYKLRKDKNKRDYVKGKYELEDFSRLNTKSKCKILFEIQKQLNKHMNEETFNIHDDIVFLNIYRLTHKKIYSILDKKEKYTEYYNCNDILEMIFNGKLHKNSLIKRKSDMHYVYLKDKINEIHFLKNFELQYYLKIKKNSPSMKSKLEENCSKENTLFLEYSEKLLTEKVKSLKNFIISPYDKNIVEIILIPKEKHCKNFNGYHKIISNLFITKYISVYFYHIIEKKIEKFNLTKKTGPIHIKIKLKTDYPQAIQSIFRYVYDKNFKIYDLDFKLLITIYIECMHLKINGITNDVLREIGEKANFDNIVKILELSSIFKETPLFKDFARIISDSGFYIFAKNYHYLLDVEMYRHLLSFDNLMISEMRIFIESIKFIIKKNCDMREQKLVFQNIRFNLLSNEHLYNIHQYVKNCFEDIIRKKYDATNFVCMRYHHSKMEQINLSESKKYSGQMKSENLEQHEREPNEEEKHDGITSIDIGMDKMSNVPFSEEIKHLNEFYKIINKEAFEPPYISKTKKRISVKGLTKCMNNIYNILFDNIFKKMLHKDEIKERCKVWNENNFFSCINDLSNENYSFQLIKRKNKVEKYTFTYGDERLINECKFFFQIVKSENSNISIGIILKTEELSVPNNHQQNSKIASILTGDRKDLVIYFDFFVNDFYACSISDDSSFSQDKGDMHTDGAALINKTKLNIHAHENKLVDGDLVNYNVVVMNQTLNLDVVILQKNISFTHSLPILKPTTFLGELIKKPFIHIKPFFLLKDSLDSIAIPSIKF
ncbi:conserved Plasmodium protein, unknown function [Plasmodium ovale]|uniref:Uncharacterized protein n=1 Tax=Plasmodium ovale TaxID=36330 RepID=A0A1D3TKK8_PLAOA|nr:conserved Plasmodium protein, unknown function [Plasmodium ovale]